MTNDHKTYVIAYLYTDSEIGVAQSGKGTFEVVDFVTRRVTSEHTTSDDAFSEAKQRIRKMSSSSEELTKIIEDARGNLRQEVPNLDLKPFSHNIIGLTLLNVAEKCGNKYANQLIDEFDLESKGWSKEPESE